MQTTQGDPAAVVASNLVQAEMALLAASANGQTGASGVARQFSDHKKIVREAYAYWRTFVETGEAPKTGEG